MTIYAQQKPVEFSDLVGKTLECIEASGDEIYFKTKCGLTYLLHHDQDCCESVFVESIVGDVMDLLDTPILKAEEATSDERPKDLPAPECEDDSQTWTFYKLATIKGYVDIRWHGSSNGYYSESVDFELVSDPKANP